MEMTSWGRSARRERCDVILPRNICPNEICLSDVQENRNSMANSDYERISPVSSANMNMDYTDTFNWCLGVPPPPKVVDFRLSEQLPMSMNTGTAAVVEVYVVHVASEWL